MTRSKNAGGEMAKAQQLDLQHITAGQRANSGRGAGQNHIARLQAEVPGRCAGSAAGSGLSMSRLLPSWRTSPLMRQADADVGQVL
jgi:hypothetical protein